MTTMDGVKSAQFWYRPVADRCGNIDLVEHVWEDGGPRRLESCPAVVGIPRAACKL